MTQQTAWTWRAYCRKCVAFVFNWNTASPATTDCDARCVNMELWRMMATSHRPTSLIVSSAVRRWLVAKCVSPSDTAGSYCYSRIWIFCTHVNGACFCNYALQHPVLKMHQSPLSPGSYFKAFANVCDIFIAMCVCVCVSRAECIGWWKCGWCWAYELHCRQNSSRSRYSSCDRRSVLSETMLVRCYVFL